MKKDKLVVYAKGKISNNIVLSLFSLFIVGISVLLFIEDKILQGCLLIMSLLSIALGYLQFIHSKKVVFKEEQLEIPIEYVQEGIPFSKTIIIYKDLKSVEFIEAQDVENDCVGSNGRKVPCIKFVDKEGGIYRMKVEFFSENQAFRIINETKQRAGIIEEENALESVS